MEVIFKMRSEPCRRIQLDSKVTLSYFCTFLFMKLSIFINSNRFKIPSYFFPSKNINVLVYCSCNRLKVHFRQTKESSIYMYTNVTYQYILTLNGPNIGRIKQNKQFILFNFSISKRGLSNYANIVPN